MILVGCRKFCYWFALSRPPCLYVVVGNYLWVCSCLRGLADVHAGTHSSVITNYKLFIFYRANSTAYQRSLYMQQRISTSELTTYAHIYYHGVSTQPAPSCHSIILSWHWSNQSLPYPNNAKCQVSKRQLSIWRSLDWLKQGSNPQGQDSNPWGSDFSNLPAQEVGALHIRPSWLVIINYLNGLHP